MYRNAERLKQFCCEVPFHAIGEHGDDSKIRGLGALGDLTGCVEIQTGAWSDRESQADQCTGGFEGEIVFHLDGFQTGQLFFAKDG